ncbi:DNA polymerase epsilon subunit 1 [Sarotherodon galilaeus]
MESTQGIYKPIRVLFNTPIYETAVKICWHLPGYRTQIAIMTEFLRLQQEDLIPPNLTAEDLRDLLVEKSRETLREQLWEFELEDFEEEEAKPLLRLVWAVNVINKMRDVEFQARMLLQFPEAIPPKFQAPKLLSVVKDYVEILKEKQQEQHNIKLLTAQEVVIEVVPRVLQGFWELPPRPLLNMASQSLSILSTSVTKATLDRVSKSLTAETQAIFTRSIRDNMVDSILTEIRQKFPQEILSIKVANFAPVLLKTIADNTNGERSSDGLSMANVPPAEGSFSESAPLPDVLCEEPLADRASSLRAEDLTIEGALSESVPEPDVPCEEPYAESKSCVEGEDHKIKGSRSEIGPVPDVPCEEPFPEPETNMKCRDLQINKKKKKKGFFKRLRSLFCCCCRPQDTD